MTKARLVEATQPNPMPWQLQSNEAENGHSARGARSLFGRKLGILYALLGSGIKQTAPRNSSFLSYLWFRPAYSEKPPVFLRNNIDPLPSRH